jgi:hypothetical protein
MLYSIVLCRDVRVCFPAARGPDRVPSHRDILVWLCVWPDVHRSATAACSYCSCVVHDFLLREVRRPSAVLYACGGARCCRVGLAVGPSASRQLGVRPSGHFRRMFVLCVPATTPPAEYQGPCPQRSFPSVFWVIRACRSPQYCCRCSFCTTSSWFSCLP